MKLEKAIEIQSQYLSQGYIMSPQDLHDSMALSIEAMKRCRDSRVKGTIWDHRALPGETED